jgi:hypothetical protein
LCRQTEISLLHWHGMDLRRRQRDARARGQPRERQPKPRNVPRRGAMGPVGDAELPSAVPYRAMGWITPEPVGALYRSTGQLWPAARSGTPPPACYVCAVYGARSWCRPNQKHGAHLIETRGPAVVDAWQWTTG